MTADDLNNLRKTVCYKNPLIHSITNPISINQCANTILAVGARPVMVEHPSEVEEITVTANSLMLNVGNITDARMESMPIAAKTATKNSIPFVLDAVGVACSSARRSFVKELIDRNAPSVIKGNYSEIIALLNDDYKAPGVDSEALPTDTVINAAAKLSQKYGSTVLVSGKTDIITDGTELVLIKNGTPQLTAITGTGCMLGALCATFLSVADSVDAAVCACAVLGICGELSETDKGNGTFFIKLMDNLSHLSDSEFKKYLKLEECTIETHRHKSILHN